MFVACHNVKCIIILFTCSKFWNARENINDSVHCFLDINYTLCRYLSVIQNSSELDYI